MKRISVRWLNDCAGRGGRVAMLLLVLCLPPALVSCGSSSPPPAVDATLNQHLAYEQPGGDETLKPFQTVALLLAATKDDHNVNALPGAGYHQIPYEILDGGNYKFCIPDDDTYVTAVELHDSSGGPAAVWRRGQPCTYVPLAAGRYSMHVHVDTSESDPPIFMKPEDVEVR